ncbi:uncharacterized protein [Parasteatoda tepidariorum]|uniref:uncharacterized protein n=1 Tax=Parasteatoda tepidariorum TaxID=114398 RepID=UPI001C7293B2|nr:uncharacterized protein LOC122272053 [Parasteatoda tepidariorum]
MGFTKSLLNHKIEIFLWTYKFLISSLFEVQFLDLKEDRGIRNYIRNRYGLLITEKVHDKELLIGADFCGQLFTGNMERLQCGLIACETHLGWLVMGRTTNDSCDPLRTNASVSITMLIHSDKIEHFWDMEVLGIKDPVEKAPKEEEVMKFFNDTLSTDIDGRYMVKLPWTDNADLPDNRIIAEKRLLSTTSKLISSGRYLAYESVFQEWERDQIIEVVPDEVPKGRCHYLPHRGVFKEHLTTRVRPVFDTASKEKGKFSLNDCLDRV